MVRWRDHCPGVLQGDREVGFNSRCSKEKWECIAKDQRISKLLKGNVRSHEKSWMFKEIMFMQGERGTHNSIRDTQMAVTNWAQASSQKR